MKTRSRGTALAGTSCATCVLCLLAAASRHGAGAEDDPASGRTFRVASIAELQSRIDAALPGDRIVVADGVYTTAGPIKVARSGAAGRPLVIAAQTRGRVEIRGAGGFDLERPAAYVVLEGFTFTHAGAVQVRAGTRHCRITRTVLEITGEGRYLVVSGDDAEIDRNTFQNKRTVGPMFSIHGPGGSGMAQRTWVHHNLFRDFTSIGRNGGETLQIGLSGRSLTDAHSLVEDNLFVRCNGENEAISNKSGANVYRRNTFRDMVGELTLRHGNHCAVYGNFFFNTHGVRFFGDDHTIHSNYFQGCDPAVQIGNGDANIPPGPLTGHDRPDRVRVSFNTLVNNKQNVVMPGRENGLGAVDLVFANNLIQGDSGTVLRLGGPLSRPRFEGNIVWGAASSGDLPPGAARRINPGLAVDPSGVFRLRSGSPAIDAAAGSYPEVTVDMDGAPRSGRKDIGADEFSRAAIRRRPLTVADVGPSAP
jgi:poly(beta-D-mannuronate) lyase